MKMTDYQLSIGWRIFILDYMETKKKPNWRLWAYWLVRTVPAIRDDEEQL